MATVADAIFAVVPVFSANSSWGFMAFSGASSASVSESGRRVGDARPNVGRCRYLDFEALLSVALNIVMWCGLVMFQLSARELLVGLEFKWPTPMIYYVTLGAMPVGVVLGLNTKKR